MIGICLLLVISFSCEEHNIHKGTLAEGIWAVTEVKGIDTTANPNFLLLQASQISFNYCTVNMNEDWGTIQEEYGECSMIVSNEIGNQFTQDEYRFHILNDETMEIKRLKNHSDNMLPDLTGSYTYQIDERNMVMKYMGTGRPALKDLEIHCWDWEP